MVGWSMSLIRSFLADVTRYQHGLAPCLLDPGCAFLRVVMLLEIGQQNVSAFPRKGEGNGSADTAVGPGYQGLLPGQPPAALVAGLAMIGLWVHLAFGARHWLMAGLEGRPWIGVAGVK